MRENIGFLKSQFELVGDDPSNKTPESTNQLAKLSEHNYTLWCSGRQCCEGMLVEIKVSFYINRQVVVFYDRFKHAFYWLYKHTVIE